MSADPLIRGAAVPDTAVERHRIVLDDGLDRRIVLDREPPADADVTALDGDGDVRPALSVVVPLKDEALSLRALHAEICAALDREALSFEVLFVDDGSADDSPAVLASLAARDPRVRVVRLRRNFGKAAALSVGFQEARGDVVVTMDADLQDDPDEIRALLAELRAGYDVVSGWKERRRDPWTRRAASRVFNWATGTLSGVRLHDANCGLKAYTAECARELAPACYGELHRFLPVLAHARGFRVGEVPVRHFERRHGRSRYGIERYVRGLLDLVTSMYLSRYARRPMHAFGGLGLLLFVISFVLLTFGVSLLPRNGPASPLLVTSAAVALAGLQAILAGLLAETLISGREAEVPYRSIPSTVHMVAEDGVGSVLERRDQRARGAG